MKIGIVGCAGRMGRMLVAEVVSTKGAALAGGTEPKESEFLGKDLRALAGLTGGGLQVTDDAASVFEEADAIIDFTVPQATVEHAALARDHGTALIIGTTGLSEADQSVVDAAAKSVPVVQAGNMSLGVNLLVGLAEQVAAALGPDYDVEVVEMHHRHKIDAPSGTALMLGQAAAKGRAVDHGEVAILSREGHTGPRPRGAIGYATLRGGDVVGDHTIVFAGPGERVELTHKAASRTIFARGAVQAAMWTEDRPPGLYAMRDVLGL